MADSEIFMTEMYDEGVVTEVIRPAAIVPEESARAVLVELALRDVQFGGLWLSDPSRWALYDSPWSAPGQPGGASDQAEQAKPAENRKTDPDRTDDPNAERPTASASTRALRSNSSKGVVATSRSASTSFWR